MNTLNNTTRRIHTAPSLRKQQVEQYIIGFPKHSKNTLQPYFRKQNKLINSEYMRKTQTLSGKNKNRYNQIPASEQREKLQTKSHVSSLGRQPRLQSRDAWRPLNSKQTPLQHTLKSGLNHWTGEGKLNSNPLIKLYINSPRMNRNRRHKPVTNHKSPNTIHNKYYESNQRNNPSNYFFSFNEKKTKHM